MNRVACIIALAGLAATLPPVPKRPHRTAKITQGQAALDLLKPRIFKTNLLVVAPVAHTFTWRYTDGINPTNYWWNIEQATSPLGPWSVVVSNATGATNLSILKNEPLRIYRLSGRLVP